MSERASAEHEKKFRATWRLREDVKDDPYWQAAYECAATYRMTIPEMNILGEVLVRKKDKRFDHEDSPDCWCGPEIEIVDGTKIITHKDVH